MRAAICISGYMQDYKTLYKNFYNYIYFPLMINCDLVDIFISTWSTENSNYRANFDKRYILDTNFRQINPRDLFKRYYSPYSRILIEDFEEIKHEFHINKYLPDFDISNLPPHLHKEGIYFALSMFYKRFTCNELKKKVELENNFKYDLVIQMRADVFFSIYIDFLLLDLTKFNAKYFLNDQVIISNSENIDKLSDLYLNINKILKDCENGPEDEITPDNKSCYPKWYTEYIAIQRLKQIKMYNKDYWGELGLDWHSLYPQKEFLNHLSCILQNYNREDELSSFVINYPEVCGEYNLDTVKIFTKDYNERNNS